MESPTHEPTAEELAVWLPGSRTVTQASRESGLSEVKLFALMNEGVVRWRVKDERGTRLVAWGDVVRYVASLPSVSPQRSNLGDLTKPRKGKK